MLDQRLNTIIHPIMDSLAIKIPSQISANTITIAGFTVGVMVVPLLWFNLYLSAMAVILANRFLDALDGAVARKCGPTNLGSSTLLKVLNEGKYEEEPQQMKRWNKANGEVLNGLIRRREAEALLFQGKEWHEV